MPGPTYKDAGVDLDLYEQAMQRLPEFVRRTHAAHPGRVMDLPGGFAGLFRLGTDDGGYRDPVLVSGTDGVGTKLKVAIAAGRYDSVGIDLVAMCVNDCLCLGAEPLFFLDYIALGKDEPDLIASLVEGVSAGCVEAQAALIGGETAIMPDLYAPGDFDMAGFCVGVVERDRLIDGTAIAPGNVLLGVASSGFHSNGYSLIRKVVFEQAGLTVDAKIDELGATVGEVLLRPTRIYTNAVRRALAQDASAVTGIAHITGGGLAENLERILPAGCRGEIDASAWDVPPEFTWLEELGGIDREEMLRVFNMGIGLVLVVREAMQQSIAEALNQAGFATRRIGAVSDGDRGVVLA